MPIAVIDPRYQNLTGDDLAAIMLADARKIAKDETEAHLLVIKWLTAIQQYCEGMQLSTDDLLFVRVAIAELFDPYRS